MLLYVVTYDIPNDKRRKKVSDLLEGYGRRVQYSVFECLLTSANRIKAPAPTKVKLEEDSVRFYPISAHTLGQVDLWGGVPLTEVPGSLSKRYNRRTMCQLRTLRQITSNHANSLQTSQPCCVRVSAVFQRQVLARCMNIYRRVRKRPLKSAQGWGLIRGQAPLAGAIS